MDDATAIDETARVFMSLGRRVENFFRMKDSSEDVVDDVGVAGGGVPERDFPRERNMGRSTEGQQTERR